MTTISLHAVPERRSALREQIAAVGLALRNEGIVIAGVFLFVWVIILIEAWRTAHPSMAIPAHGGVVGYRPGGIGMSFGPLAAVPVSILAFLVPYGVWGSGDSGSRRYMLSLPVSARDHCMMRVLAGWLWLLAAVAVYVVWIVFMNASANAIMGRYSQPVDAWEWLVPFTAVTVAYLLGSIAVVGTRHPLRWMSGIALTWLLIAGIVDVNMRGVGVNWAARLFDGQYGLAAAIFGDIEHRGGGIIMGPLHTVPPDLGRWLLSTLIWGVPALGAVRFMAARKRDE